MHILTKAAVRNVGFLEHKDRNRVPPRPDTCRSRCGRQQQHVSVQNTDSNTTFSVVIRLAETQTTPAAGRLDTARQNRFSRNHGWADEAPPSSRGAGAPVVPAPCVLLFVADKQQTTAAIRWVAMFSVNFYQICWSCSKHFNVIRFVSS